MARQYGSKSEQADIVKKELMEEAAKQNKKMRAIKLGVGLGIVAISSIMLMSNLSHISSVSDKTAKLNEEIASAKEVYKQKKEEAGDVKEIIIYDDPIVHSAKEIGEAVCKTQNELSRLTNEELANNSAITDAHKKLLLDMKSYFFGQPDAAVTWCRYGEWIYESTYDYEGDVLDITWLCYAPTDTSHSKLLACATATYSASVNELNDFKIYYTSWFSLLDSPSDENGVVDYPVTIPGPGESGPPNMSYSTSSNE